MSASAISTSPDPTGSYYRYALSTGTNFPDYPKLGVGSNAYYFATREFAGGTAFAGIGVYALNRAQLIAGNPAAQVISFLVPPGATPYNTGDGLQPADIDGSVLPPPGSPHYYVGSMDDGGPYGAPQDALTLWKFNADFATPANSTFVLDEHASGGRVRLDASRAPRRRAPAFRRRGPRRRSTSCRIASGSCTGWRTATTAPTNRW